jgi:hypothetical protein
MSFGSSPLPPGLPPTSDPWDRHVNISTDAALAMGWQALKQNYGILLGILAISIAISLALWLVQQLVKHVPLGALTVSVLTSFFVSLPLNAGLSYVGVKAVRGEALRPADLFLGFTNYWNIVGVGVLNMLITIACIVPFACMIGIGAAVLGHAGPGGAPALGGLVALIIGVIAMVVLMVCITTRLIFAPMLCLDPRWHNPPVTECLKISWRITKSCWGSIFVAMFLTGLLCMASVLLLGVGVFLLGWPLMVCTIGALYVIVSNAFLDGQCSHCGAPRDDTPDPCPHCGGTEPLPA